MYISDIELGRRASLDNVQTVAAAEFLGIDPVELLKTAGQQRGEVTIKTESAAALDLLTSLARGKRPDKTYRQLLDVLSREDKSGEKTREGMSIKTRVSQTWPGADAGRPRSGSRTQLRFTRN